MEQNEVIADALKDLGTDEGKLSLWKIDDGYGNLEQVVAALAAGRDEIANFDYALIDWDHLVKGLKLEVENTHGTTHDQDCNSRYHCDVVRLTASRVTAIAESVSTTGRLERKTLREVAQLVHLALESNRIAPSAIKDKLRQSLVEARLRFGF